MPDDNSAAWAAAGNAAAGLANTLSTDATNRQTRRFSREMYDRTRNDNLEFWNMQNAYNTPSQQMARFKDAGLNPNLIYGSSGDNSAGNIPTPDVLPAPLRAPEIDPHSGTSAMALLLAQADLRIKNAQANNLGEQTEVIRQDAILRALQAQKEGVDISQAGFNLAYDKDTRAANIDFLSESTRQKRVSSDLAINADARAAIQTASNVSEAANRILNMIETRKGFVLDRAHTVADTARIRQNIIQMQKDGTLKDFEISLNDRNVTKSDPLWIRMILDFLSGDSGKVAPPPFVPYKDVPLTPKRY